MNNFWFCLLVLCGLAILLVRSQPEPPDDESDGAA